MSATRGSTREFATADVAQDGEEPRFHRRPAKRIEMAQRAQIAFLHGVFGIGAVAEQISRQCVNIVEMGQRGVAKTPRLVIVIAAPDTRHHVVPGFPEIPQALSLRSIEHYCAALLPVAASTTMVPVFHVQARLEDEAQCLLVIIGAPAIMPPRYFCGNIRSCRAGRILRSALAQATLLVAPSGNCRTLSGHHDRCGPDTLLLHQREQSGGVLRM